MIELMVLFVFIVGYCICFYMLIKHFKDEDCYGDLAVCAVLILSLFWFALLPAVTIIKVAKKLADKI